MSRRLRVTEQSLRRVAEWSPTAPQLWRSRMAELLKSFEDGTWEGRWYPPKQIAADPDVFMIDPDAHLHVHFRVYADEALDHEWFVDVFDITRSGLASSGEYA